MYIGDKCVKNSYEYYLDKDVKEKSQILLSEFGLDLSTAVNIFLRQMLREQAIPFKIRQDVPNSITISAIKEADEMENNPELYKSYKNIDELMEDLTKRDMKLNERRSLKKILNL